MDEIILKRIADYCKGEISKEDFEKLGEWLSENPDNRTVLKSYVELYKKGREISFLENWDREASWQKLSRRLENSRKERAGRLRWLVRRFAATAAACLLFVGGVYYFYDNREVEKRPYGLAMIQPGSTKAVLELPNGSEIALEDTSAFYMQEQGTVVRQDSGRALVYEKRGAQEKAVYHTLRVPVGGEYHLVLSDGTQVWLNSASEFHYPTRFDGDIREVSFPERSILKWPKIPCVPLSCAPETFGSRCWGLRLTCPLIRMRSGWSRRLWRGVWLWRRKVRTWFCARESRRCGIVRVGRWR